MNINVLVFIFEQEFYIPTSSDKPFYDRRITKLREIRNDDSHRCSVYNYNKEQVIKDYEAFRQKMDDAISRKKFPTPTTKENEIELKYNVLKFLEEKDYLFVRKIVREASIIVKNELLKYSHKKSYA